MPAIRTTALAVAIWVALPAAAQVCDWRNPGSNKYVGETSAAARKVPDIPPAVRERLAARLERGRLAAGPDGQIEVTAARAVADDGSTWTFRDINGGTGAICRGEVSRANWTPGRVERALVYIDRESGYAVAVFSVCRNVAQAIMLTPPVATPAPTQRTASVTPVEPEPTPVATPDPVPTPEPAPVVSLGLPEVPVTFATPDPVPDATPTPSALPGPTLPPFGGLTPIPYPVPVRIPTPVPVVPEPATWLMLLLGLGLVARVARRG